MMAAGSVVAMADEESAPLMNMIAETNENMQNIVMFDEAVQGEYIEEYSHQAVFNKYQDLFQDREIQMEGVYLKNICINKSKESYNNQDYTLSAMLLDEVVLENGESIVVMAFVQTDDSCELLGTPKQMFAKLMKPYNFRLPFSGKENPNLIRVVAFLKSEWQSLELGENLEITNFEIIIEEESFIFKDSLKSSWDIIKSVENILQ
jgi:hypothetical protein